MESSCHLREDPQIHCVTPEFLNHAPPHPAGLRVLLRFFRLESHRLQLPQGVRATLAISAPIGVGLAFHQLAAAVIVTLGAWFVLVTDTGGAYRQKAIATLSATAGVGCAILGASILNVSPVLTIVGTFLLVGPAALVGIFGNTATTVGFSTSLMFVITVALPHASDMWRRGDHAARRKCRSPPARTGP